MDDKLFEQRMANLKPIKDPQRARELQLIGAKKRKQNGIERKKMREELTHLLKITLKKGDLILPEEVTNLAEAKDLNIPVQTAINIAMIQRAIMGDVQAATWVRDTIGEKPTDKVELDQTLTIEAWAKNHDVKL